MVPLTSAPWLMPIAIVFFWGVQCTFLGVPASLLQVQVSHEVFQSIFANLGHSSRPLLSSHSGCSGSGEPDPDCLTHPVIGELTPASVQPTVNIPNKFQVNQLETITKKGFVSEPLYSVSRVPLCLFCM